MMVTRQVRPAAPPRQLSGLGFCVVGFENLTGGNNGIFIRSSSRTSSVVALLASPMGPAMGDKACSCASFHFLSKPKLRQGLPPRCCAFLEMGIRPGKFAVAVTLGPQVLVVLLQGNIWTGLLDPWMLCCKFLDRLGENRVGRIDEDVEKSLVYMCLPNTEEDDPGCCCCILLWMISSDVDSDIELLGSG
ncbi:hypothetical protein MJT46_007953 [Ovis ammon polii x Ovis aries]|nr:hypothetical protein MJT46_007953 [Ovis ammon polii x Ovis aries]